MYKAMLYLQCKFEKVFWCKYRKSFLYINVCNTLKQICERQTAGLDVLRLKVGIHVYEKYVCFDFNQDS